MTTPQILDLFGLLLGAAFIACAAAGAIRSATETLAAQTRAVRASVGAMVVAYASVLIHALDVPNDGIFWPALWTATATLSTKTVLLRIRRREAIGARVVADAERFMREQGGHP